MQGYFEFLKIYKENLQQFGPQAFAKIMCFPINKI